MLLTYNFKLYISRYYEIYNPLAISRTLSFLSVPGHLSNKFCRPLLKFNYSLFHLLCPLELKNLSNMYRTYQQLYPRLANTYTI